MEWHSYGEEINIMIFTQHLNTVHATPISRSHRFTSHLQHQQYQNDHNFSFVPGDYNLLDGFCGLKFIRDPLFFPTSISTELLHNIPHPLSGLASGCMGTRS